MTVEQMTAAEVVAKIGEFADAYRQRHSQLAPDHTIYVLAPLWAVDRYREALNTIGRDIIVDAYDDTPPPGVDNTIAVARDQLRLYFHAGFVGPRPGDYDGTLELGIIP